METNPKTKSKTDAAEQFREMAEKSATQSKEVYEKMSGPPAKRPTLCKIAVWRRLKGYRITITS